MIKSKFILDIFDLALDDNESENLLRLQLPYLTEKEFEHTTGGLYVYFSQDPKIVTYKINLGNEISVLDGIEIRNDGENVLADSVIHIKNGLINYLEIFNKNGEDYPIEELDSYEMSQTWGDLNKRRTIKK